MSSVQIDVVSAKEAPVAKGQHCAQSEEQQSGFLLAPIFGSVHGPVPYLG